MQKPHLYSGGRYPVLRSLGILYLVAGGLILLAGLVAAGWALMRAPGYASDRVVLAITALVGTFFLVLTMLAIAELIKLFIDLEHNTRMTAGRMIDASISAGGASGANADATRIGGRMHDMAEESAEAALLRGH
jgi:hypothetical protein